MAPPFFPPASGRVFDSEAAEKMVSLELQDSSVYQGYSFGADKSIAGELVFQTGMVGYPESLTDPSYRGQILVLTFPLIGNYGVPSRAVLDALLADLLPAHFESSQIHVAGLVTASYAGEDFSHFLAESSLGAWLKEQGVPAMHAVDTRELTKHIRESGSMLGRMLLEKDGGLSSAAGATGANGANGATSALSSAISSTLSSIVSSPAVGTTNGATNGTTGTTTTTTATTPADDDVVIDRSLLAPYTAANWRPHFEAVDWLNPNAKNLVADVSIRAPKLFRPPADKALKHPSGRTLRILCLDVGMKYNQLRCFLKRGVEVLVVPYDYDVARAAAAHEYDGLFLSNGPGDPATLDATVRNIASVLATNQTPVFGICLGHQLLARATGATTTKMKFGNRGQNIPCTSLVTGRCHITSQNHGYAVDAASLADGWQELFVNANDGSNEGIMHTSRPYFSVQFHPESTPGPRDTEFLFDVFLGAVQTCAVDPAHLARPVRFPGGTAAENDRLHPRVHVKKVLVLGSGGLSIGQAGEFDYSGSQAIKALKEEGIYTVLINPNIATIQTSKGLADKVFFLPVNAEFVRKVIVYERPDAIYCTFGGQTALQVGIQLKDELAGLGVQVLGTPIDTIITTEDRELFARSMESIGEKCAKSASANTVEEALHVVKDIGFPVIVRAAYALGGLGSGFANNEDELLALCHKAFAASPQVLIERSMKGWKEIEYEVVRDAQDNCITVCNMENFDPLGIHTGDSIVVAPSQTLSDEDYNMLRTTAVNVIRHLGVVGECNIQYALNPFSREYCIIEVNARLSRSSALASKATGYPLAFVAAKLGLGIPLKDIKNSVTQVTCACFEPSLDYVVVKMPRWDLKKFTRVSTQLGSSMKSIGEVMSIGRTFEEAIQTAIRAIDFHNLGFAETKGALIAIDDELQTPSDQRLFAIANAMAAGYSVDKIWELTKIDRWFLNKLKGLSDFARRMTALTTGDIVKRPDLLLHAKRLGFSDRQLALFWSSNEIAVRRLRLEAGIHPWVKQIDTVAAEFPAFTNYLYLTYSASTHDLAFDDKGVMVLGSGVYRIGSSVEFDWCSVRAIRTLRAAGLKTIMVNTNPETLSTDYDEADRLYFTNIDLETVMDIYELEQSAGILGAMSGQTPNMIALPLLRAGAKVLGTSPEMIDTAENRYKFSRMLDRIDVDQPTWKELTSFEDAKAFCDKVSYPVLVRPSYVLSGAAMNTVYSEADLASYLQQAAEVSREHPVVITKYIENAKEIEMDAVAKDGVLVGHFISEHVENAGVHSGDATLIQPPQDLERTTIKRIEEATRKIGAALNITGPFNIQFIAKDNDIKVIECNVRASRSFPFVSKVTGVDLIEMATRAIMNLPFEEYPPLELAPGTVGVKVPQFSFSRLSGADPILGVEMASTGEVACFGADKYEAYLKALVSTGFKMPRNNVLLSIGSYKDKKEMLPSVAKLQQLGYKLFATAGTADYLQEHGIPVQYLEAFGKEDDNSGDETSSSKAQKGEFSLTQHLAKNMIDLYINLPSNNKYRRPANFMSKGYRTRRMAVDYQIPLVTNVKNAKILIEAMARHYDLEVNIRDYTTSHRTVVLPGLVNVAAFVPGLVAAGGSTDLQAVTKASIAAGFSMVRVMPLGVDGAITDVRTLKLAQQNGRRASAYCDFNLSVTATSTNASQISQVVSEVGSLFIPFNHLSDNISKVAAVTAHFEAWPTHKPIVTDAKTTDLASLLLLASLHNRRIHVTNVTSRDDVRLIALSKEKGLQVTCDVSIYALYLSQTDYPGCTLLPTADDQAALWEHIAVIDVFSVGSLPYQLAHWLQSPSAGGGGGGGDDVQVDVAAGIADALPLLFTSVAEGRLTLDDLRARLHDNPVRIFELHDQVGTAVEIELNRPYTVPATSASPFAGRTMRSAVQRVTFQDVAVCLDGEVLPLPGYGKDMSTHNAMPVVPQTPVSPQIKAQQQQQQTETTPDSPHGSGRRQSALLSSALRTRVGLDTSAGGGTLSSAASGGLLGSAAVTPSAGALAAVNEDAAYALLPAPATTSLAVRSALPSLLSQPSSFKNKPVLSVLDYERADLHLLFTVAQEMRLGVQREGVLDVLRGRVLCTLFYEPSTRTSASFDAAMQRLGGRTVAVATSHSSVQKGESLQDTLRTLGQYGDAVVLRHPDERSVDVARRFSPVPVINGGNGSREHPTQAFLDLFTIREELGTVQGLTITFLGDLRYGRPVHSLVHLLRHYHVQVQLVSPAGLELPAVLRDELKARGQLLREAQALTPEIVARSDVLYCTRVQKERFPSEAAYEQVKNAYRVDNATLKHAKSNMIVLHPLPRNEEIAEEVDFDQRAAYFRQMRYGLYCRMALLALVMST
ncbi:carbamoyl-phosphate synthase [Sporothrix schenckii 1099-18]|uniref:Pyrimidine-specific carbamoyl phosphate synthase-aspartate carbamoyl transferase n=2 Tax=Sporothrix schenckii TaxID=29908 RepID=A0A0F2M0Y6_SPOSC|nr:carbamoyl-phosphate synthase [Sporothrix schenckii 1099-18]KJR81816.1 carbamoyl-phosphate synthase [Sporothrix schenckii 1099-18]